MLENFGLKFENFMLPENFGHLIKVYESFHYFFPNIFGHSGKSLPDTPEKLGQFVNCILPSKFGQIIKNKFFWGLLPTILGAL
jgi:hypothetical protein